MRPLRHENRNGSNVAMRTMPFTKPPLFLIGAMQCFVKCVFDTKCFYILVMQTDLIENVVYLINRNQFTFKNY